MKTFGGSNRSATPPAGQAPTPAPATNHTPPAKPPASTGRALGGGRPPPDPNAGEGGFEKRDDAYWDAHPLKPGPHEFDCYVSKIVWWANGGITVTFRVTDWDHAANRPNEHHGRQFAWEQGHGKRTGAAYNAWRAEIVGAYAAGDWPEEKWPKADNGNPAPPWHLFWIHQCSDGLVVPTCLRVQVNKTPPTERGNGFVNVKRVAPLRTGDGQPFQAPMPFELPRDVAELHGWRVGDARSIVKDDVVIATTVKVDKDAVPLGHLGLPTYKDL